jgi:sugar/nucleoside kinase (ribokinase family)
MSDRPYDVAIVGEVNVDIILTGDVVPEFGQVEKLVDDFVLCAGASSAIFASAAAKMGLSVRLASVVGDDLFGHYMIEALRESGVDTTFIRVDRSLKTGAGIHLSKGGDRAMLTYLGSIGAVGPDLVDAAWYQMARHLHVASPFLLTSLRPAMPEMMRAAHAAGMTVSLDTNWDPEDLWRLQGFWDHLDVFLPNENELRAISGEADLTLALERMKTRVPVLVLKRGAKGATVVKGDERHDAPALPVLVADATGAGDSFDGGFLAGWLRGEPLRRCLLLGTACGSLTTRQIGGFNGQPTWDEAMSAIRLYGMETGLS